MAGNVARKFNKKGRMPSANCTNRFGQRIHLTSFDRFMHSFNESKKKGDTNGKRNSNDSR